MSGFGPMTAPTGTTNAVVVGRKYLPTEAELVDRLSIVLLKRIFIHEHCAEYEEERGLIKHDLNLLLPPGMTADALEAAMLVAITNRFIWENESRARQGGPDQDRLLKLTHSVNGVRNTAKNVYSGQRGGRLDHKTDCFAEDLIEEFGNWNVFD